MRTDHKIKVLLYLYVSNIYYRCNKPKNVTDVYF
jgi:hypothetical protein